MGITTDNENVWEVVSDYDHSKGSGQKPKPLKSSWHLHQRYAAPPRKPIYVIFLDDRKTGITLGSVKDPMVLNDAIRELIEQGYDVLVRPHVIDDNSLEQEAQARRRDRQLGTSIVR